MQTGEPRWANKRDAAEHIGVSEVTLWRMVRDGKVTAYTHAGITRYNLTELDEAFLSGAESVTAGATRAG